MSRYPRLAFLLLVAAISLGLVWVTERQARRALPAELYLSGARLTAFTSLEPIDAHTHVFAAGPAFLEMLARLHVQVLDILFVDDRNSYRGPAGAERQDGLTFVATNAAHARLCTTFDPFRFQEANFSQAAIAQLHEDYARGAVALKIWKNIGMEITDSSGRYVMPDDERFEPIYRDAAAEHKTLIVHAAEPDDAWETGGGKGYFAPYYAAHPEWDMSKIPGAPRKELILQARDHLLELNPQLRVVGAHFGSMDMQLDELAERLDRYPNFAVDTAARVMSLVLQPRDRVRAFLIRYQDRILYGTDLNFYPGSEDLVVAQAWQKAYGLDWRFFATDDRFYYKDVRTRGLALPPAVLQKLYHDNAVRWIPGIQARRAEAQSVNDTQ
jgi:predicted TIM-barrel fold metal-dependent hydrolase